MTEFISTKFSFEDEEDMSDVLDSICDSECNLSFNKVILASGDAEQQGKIWGAKEPPTHEEGQKWFSFMTEDNAPWAVIFRIVEKFPKTKMRINVSSDVHDRPAYDFRVENDELTLFDGDKPLEAWWIPLYGLARLAESGRFDYSE